MADLPLPSAPPEATRRNVFVINDIDLVVPPANIEVHQEDLLYNWRTLRSKATTKIATGHGQVRVHVTIPFTNAMILDLHRLIVEFRHSPFCYIKNRYLRESIVPDWPLFQSMAFTLTSINVAPLPGSSDAWVCELDLVWFNYLPFLHNFLYREDWNTNWLVLDSSLEQNDRVKLSIGWDLDPGTLERTARLSTIETDPNSDVEGVTHLNWSTLASGYTTREQNTIFDMEQLHFGESFDLLPLPGNMEPSRFVTDPRNSRIYTRFINYLQRDAMIKHFGFNPEEMLGKQAAAFFGAIETEVGLRTFGLHTSAVDRQIRNDWIGRMLKFNGNVKFHFHVFKDIRLPSKWTDVARSAKLNALQTIIPPTPQGTSNLLQATDALGVPTGSPLEVRSGWWDPVGKHVPLGDSPTSTTPMSISEVLSKVVARVSLRSKATDAQIYSSDSRRAGAAAVGGTRYHYGTDISAATGTPLFAVAPGRVTIAALGAQGQGVSWQYWDTSTSTRGFITESKDLLDDWELTIAGGASESLLVDKGNRGGFGPSVIDQTQQPIGTFVRSVGKDNIFYFTNYSDGGQQIRIQHDDGSKSDYLHVNEMFVRVGDYITESELSTRIIGTVGNTSTLKDSYILDGINSIIQNPSLFGTSDPNSFDGGNSHLVRVPVTQLTPNADDDIGEETPFSVIPHLHFRYREAANLTPPNTGSVNGFAPPPASGSIVEVDPIPSWEAATDKTRPDIIAVSFQAQVEQREDQPLLDTTDIDTEEFEQITNLLVALNDDGWVYYEEDSSITNIWYKHIEIEVSGNNGPGPDFTNDTIVIANAAGGLRHVVANIPILGHEYPTQQHLGSIEPTFMMDFTVRDDSTNLEGISETAKSLQGMRNLLQQNARRFRPIVDAWTVATDTFITRLFGSYNDRDVIRVPVSTEGFVDEIGVAQAELTKRTTIARSGAGIIKGQPGASYISFELQETNPFDFEKLQSTAIDRVDLDAARQEVLTKLYGLDFMDQLESQALSLALAQLGNANLINPDNEDFGQFTIPILSASEFGLGLTPDVFIDPQFFDEGTILIRDQSGLYQQLAESVGKAESDLEFSSYGPSANYAGYIEIPESVIGVPIETPAVTSEFTSTGQSRTYDISNLLLGDEADPVLNNVDFRKLTDYYKLVADTLHVAERLMVEHSGKGIGIRYDQEVEANTGEILPASEGLEDSVISDELFGLPFDAKQWRSWQEYILSEARKQAGEEAAIQISNSDNWLSWRGVLDDRTKQEVQAAGFSQTIPILGTTAISFETLIQTANFDAVSNLMSSSFAFADAAEAERRNASFILANGYNTSFPLETTMQNIIESYGYSSLFGSLLGNSDENQPRAFENFTSHLVESVRESGFWVPDFQGLPMFQFRIQSQQDIPGDELTETDTQLGFDIGTINGWWNGNAPDYSDPNDLITTGLVGLLTAPLPPPIAKQLVARHNAGFIQNPHFKWIVNQTTELEKLEHFKRIMARIADDILADADMLAILGLTGLADLTKRGRIVGTEAYPDIELPFHPFFGDTLSVNPDFYMWNIYEDGGALSTEVQDQVKEAIDHVIDNCYNSLKNLEKGSKSDPTKNPLITEPAIDGVEQLQINVKYHAEGTDEGDFGPMDTPYYPLEEAHHGREQFDQQLGLQRDNLQRAADQLFNETPPGALASGPTPGTGALPEDKKITTTKVNVRVAATEGYYGRGGGVQYPRRLSMQEYESLRQKVESVENMFGTKLGFQQENLTLTSAPTLKGRLTGSKLDRPDEYVHAFSPGQLKKLALDSSKDIVSQKMTLKRAYPTFKLFFVEEDEFESRTLNFDDFHSYNAVQSFYVEMSRKTPADHAVITVQNVSGTLDGTKRGAVVDLDYFGRDAESKIPDEASSFSGDALNKDTTFDQPLGAIVMRPGLNVQLRCGYSNDPESLHVLVSGRIIDVHWNKTGDLAEIMVQSFGTELEQAIKGTQRTGIGQIFYSTHQLLGSLMLEPEIVHFGRWEIGQLFQIGESSDFRLDFRDYRAENFLGRFQLVNNAMQWAQDHPYMSIGLIGLTGGGVVPAAVAGALSADLIAEVGAEAFERISDATVGRLKKFFITKQTSLFLSPQDDNLFPPHPKDYMKLDRGLTETFTDWVVGKLGAAVGENTITANIGETAFRWWMGGDLSSVIFDKKVIPADCLYQLVSTTTWNVFHEMSLRHPGWIYGCRPYGNDFRYTMFFGVPSQRYWSRPASNVFINRVNDLNEFLSGSQNKGPEQLELEYKKLYGEESPEGKTIDELKDEAAIAAVTALESEGVTLSPGPLSPAVLTETPTFPKGSFARDPTMVPVATEIPDTAVYKAQLHQRLTGPALKEYLRALNFRFVPFRRYHMFSSERDLVWNGLLSAENAVTNAVDVTYFNDETLARDSGHAPVASALFKAHSFIPEHQLRIAPVRWQNCKGYNMAMRYGMGELIHRMKEMYRGEIIILGNPRVRPWDIGILMDAYNDMVGPVEVEQVVHSFSHETGFITEIKPAAVVFGNEISSWPILEALKTFSLAVRDIEDNYIALREANGDSNENTDTDAGFIRDVADILVDWDSEDMNQLFRERAAQNHALSGLSSTAGVVFEGTESTAVLTSDGLNLESAVFDGDLPESNAVTTLVNVSEVAVKAHGLFNAIGGAVTGGVVGGAVAGPLGALIGPALGAAPGLAVATKLDFPGLAWLVGGPILFLQCLRQDSVIVVPVIKGGSPIVSGLAYHDPSMIWSHLRGDLREFVDDVLDGTRDMLGEYKRLGTHIWNGIEVENLLTDLATDPQVLAQQANLTGGSQ